MFAVCYDLFPEFLEKVEEVKKSDEMCVTVLASSCQFLPSGPHITLNLEYNILFLDQVSAVHVEQTPTSSPSVRLIIYSQTSGLPQALFDSGISNNIYI